MSAMTPKGRYLATLLPSLSRLMTPFRPIAGRKPWIPALEAHRQLGRTIDIKTLGKSEGDCLAWMTAYARIDLKRLHAKIGCVVLWCSWQPTAFFHP